MPNILVISNCQAYGLANCLKLSGVRIRADGCDIDRFRRESDVWIAKFKEYDYIVVAPEAGYLDIVNFANMDNIVWLPTFYFPAFHGDLTYATSNDILIKTPLDGYNSKLILSGYKRGLSKSQTASLFNIETFQSIGYLDTYDQASTELLQRYAEHGINLQSALVTWMRDGIFVYSVNHPKVSVLYDIASLLLKKLGLKTREHQYLPHDNLANGPIFPVFPEIATFYGFSNGSYFYKSAYDYQTYDLNEFIEESYEVYNHYEVSSISYTEINGAYRDSFDKILTKVAE